MLSLVYILEWRETVLRKKKRLLNINYSSFAWANNLVPNVQTKKKQTLPTISLDFLPSSVFCLKELELVYEEMLGP